MTRRDDIAAGLARVRDRIARARAAVGRTDEVTLVVVTKFFPAADVRLLADLGVADVGENRHQEAAAKAAECADLALRWHFIGGMQRNKATAIARYAQVVESVDRIRLVAPLARGAESRPQPLDCLLQVSLDPPGRPGRSGAAPADIEQIAAAVQETASLRLRGLMAIAPVDEDPAAAFDRLARIREDFTRTWPASTWLSAGMSGDLEQAIAAGATHVRVGSAILGERPRIK